MEMTTVQQQIISEYLEYKEKEKECKKALEKLKPAVIQIFHDLDVKLIDNVEIIKKKTFKADLTRLKKFSLKRTLML